MKIKRLNDAYQFFLKKKEPREKLSRINKQERQNFASFAD